MKRTFTIPNWLRPERTIITFTLFCAAVVVPSCTYVTVQEIRLHRRAAQVARLQLGITRDQVVALVGHPTSANPDHSFWYYRSNLPNLLRLPFVEPDEMVVVFSPKSHVVKAAKLCD